MTTVIHSYVGARAHAAVHVTSVCVIRTLTASLVARRTPVTRDAPLGHMTSPRPQQHNMNHVRDFRSPVQRSPTSVELYKFLYCADSITLVLLFYVIGAIVIRACGP